MKEIQIGIIGTGNIAAKFARACALTPGVCAAGVCSRSAQNGARFAAEHGIGRVYPSAAEMAAAEGIDLIYVATPHAAHFENCMTALRAGKPVLCEKPMAMHSAEAKALFAEAHARGVFLMEGMWTRFLPNSIRAREWIGSGRIGAVRFIDGMFSCGMDPAHPVPRLIEPALGGGALLDIGVYTIEMASWYAGAEPVEWSSLCTPYSPGVDALTAVLLRYPGGALATLRTGILCEAPARMTVFGEKGRVELPRFFSGAEALLYEGDTLVEHVREQTELPEGFCPQLAAVRDCLLAGMTECPVVPAAATLKTAEIMESVLHGAFPEWY